MGKGLGALSEKDRQVINEAIDEAAKIIGKPREWPK